MTVIEFFRTVCEDIHSTVVATADKNNLPVTCVIDIMDYDSDGLYFLTARGKNFYDRLKAHGYLSHGNERQRHYAQCFGICFRICS